MSCIHQDIDIYNNRSCKLTNKPCNIMYGCPDRTDNTPTYNSTTNKFEVVENGEAKEYQEQKEDMFALYGGKAKWANYYAKFDDCIGDFITSAKLDHSEHSYEILKAIADEVIEDIRESWYRRSLGKSCH